MTARIIPMESDEHREAQALLPWLANGTLPAAELERVRSHLATCEKCRADADLQDALWTAAHVASPSGADVDRGWAALRARLVPRDDESPPVSAWRRFGWPVLAGAQAVVIVALAISFFLGTGQKDAEYRTLGNVPPAPAANTLVVFRPGASEAQIRQALRSVQARIVDGPTVTDAYVLYLPSPSPDQFARLRADASVLRVESLRAGSP
jgi:anti-sigma factor RsiW